MGIKTKKFISPNAWFSFEYPVEWTEFADEQGTFLFYNAGVWDGNFRVSAYRGGNNYGEEVLNEELKHDKKAKTVSIGGKKTIYTTHEFEEDNVSYVSHNYLVVEDCMAFECSFTTYKEATTEVVDTIIKSIEIRKDGVKYAPELIDIRLNEIDFINDCYEWVVSSVKKKYAVSFEGEEKDIAILQQFADSGDIGKKKRDEWIAVGITLCVIITNEVEGTEWRTLIDGNREDAVLMYKGKMIDPMKLAWSKIKNGLPLNLEEEYNRALTEKE